MEELTEGNLNEVVISGFITAMNTKGASADEIAGCASVLMKEKGVYKSLRKNPSILLEPGVMNSDHSIYLRLQLLFRQQPGLKLQNTETGL